MYRTKRLLSKNGGMENCGKIDSKDLFCKPAGQSLNFQVLANWLEGAPAWAPRIVHQLKLNNPYRSFSRPFAKSIVLPSVFHTFAYQPTDGGSQKYEWLPGRADSIPKID